MHRSSTFETVCLFVCLFISLPHGTHYNELNKVLYRDELSCLNMGVMLAIFQLFLLLFLRPLVTTFRDCLANPEVWINFTHFWGQPRGYHRFCLKLRKLQRLSKPLGSNRGYCSNITCREGRCLGLIIGATPGKLLMRAQLYLEFSFCHCVRTKRAVCSQSKWSAFCAAPRG